MLASHRTRAALAATLFALAACGEETPLPTNLETAEVTADVEITQAAFENTQTEALSEMGYLIDNALINLGGLPASMASIVASGPTRVNDPRSAHRLVERAEELTGSGPVSAIPASALGKVLVWNLSTEQYEVSAITGAPANGVRFRLYALNPETLLPADPLVVVGYVDITRGGTANNPTARLALYNAADTKLLDYVATLGGTQQVPSFSIVGTAGTGANSATFSLSVAVNVINQTVTAIWRTEIPSRGLTSRTTLSIGENSFVLTGVMQRGLSKVEVSGTLNFTTGGSVTVKVGNRVFATMTINALFEPSEFVSASGEPLTAEQQETLALIFDWFDSTWNWYGALLDPVYTVLDVPLNNN